MPLQRICVSERCVFQLQLCIIFLDEIDAIGRYRFSEGTNPNREIHRTLVELLNQLHAFDQLRKVYHNIRRCIFFG